VIQDHIQATLEKIREPMALDRWDIRPAVGPIADARAACAAEPEYRTATLLFDLDKLQTGDVLDEVTVHEMTHCHIWPLHALAENLAMMIAESMPGPWQAAMEKGLKEEVRKAAETVTTDVGQTYLRLFRRAGILDKPN
jgi:hypothetical protein